MTLSRGDDYPLHQTPEPVAFAGTDRNFYDRYFFNGYDPGDQVFFAAAFGIYPHLDVADAHFSVLRGGRQVSLHASVELGMERMTLRAGPIGIAVVEPLHCLRVTVNESEGVACDLTFTGRAPPIEEPRFTRRLGPRMFMDYTRMTQNGRWEGWIEIDGARHELGAQTMGTRDRSWGIRPIGTRDAQAIPGHEMPAFFWQWTPLNFADGSLFYHLNADPDGTPWNTRAVWLAHGPDAAPVEGEGALATVLEGGTRWPAASVLTLTLPSGPREVRLEPLHRFQMRGIGYTHPEWGHGLHHGTLRVAREDEETDRIEAARLDNLHVQILCRATADDGREGFGVFEQLAIGPYEPLGLRGLTDGA